MHELGYTRSILDSVCLAAENAGAHQVKSVHLTIGEMRDIVDDLFCGCFSYLAKSTIAENSELIINHVPLTVRCKACNGIYPADFYSGEHVTCPSCHTDKYSVNTGMEFYVDHIEVD